MTCSEISVIPQYGPTCWFNAILMSSFYSQLLRSLLINKISKTWIDKKGNNSIFKFFKKILKNSYETKDKKIIKQFNKINPDELLLHILNINNSDLLSYVIETDNLGWHSNYIYEFLKFLDVNVLYLHYMRNDKIIANFDNFLLGLNKKYLSFSDVDYETKFYEISKAINEPDVIILEHHKLFENSRIMHLHDLISKKNAHNLVYDLELTFNLKLEEFKDLIDLKEEIEFRGNLYKLDSILLNDYDLRHVIAGITCNNEKYVYNGWNVETNDPSFKSDKKYHIDEPCKLMKYDWNINNTNEFCLNTKECKLDKITDRRDLCFSFNKGQRRLVYVKVSPMTSSSLSVSSLSSSSFKSFSPNAKVDLKDTFEIEIAKLEEIEIDKRLNKIDPNKIKLPLKLKRKIVLYNLFDKNKIEHQHINNDIIKYVHSTFDINKLFEKAKIQLGHFYLPDEINKDIFRINFYKYFQLDYSKFDENIDDIIKTKLRLTPITDMSKYDATKIMNINGENFDIQTLFYYYFIVHLETTFDNIINNKIEIDLRKIFESQISLEEIINNYEDIISNLRKIYKFNKNINQIIDYKLIVKLFGIEFMSLYLTKEKRSLEDLIKFLQDSNETEQDTIVYLFNLLNLLPNNIRNIKELIEFLNKEFVKKIGGNNNRIVKRQRLLKTYKN